MSFQGDGWVGVSLNWLIISHSEVDDIQIHMQLEGCLVK